MQYVTLNFSVWRIFHIFSCFCTANSTTLSQKNHRVSPDIHCVALDILRNILFHNEFSLIFFAFPLWMLNNNIWKLGSAPWITMANEWYTIEMRYNMMYATKKNEIHATLFTCILPSSPFTARYPRHSNITWRALLGIIISPTPPQSLSPVWCLILPLSFRQRSPIVHMLYSFRFACFPFRRLFY